MDESLYDEIDGHRHSRTDRSLWFRNAARVRLALEDAGRWPPEDLDVDLEEEAGESTA
ncbi:hypothetical protein [Halorussus sp. AFM4]|uniref:hypothetical protein n=1 Tax=Halorussus sp. AFM4 TaxID=3421651 RepID=UPI003EBCA390